MLDNPTLSIPANKVSDYELSEFRVKLYSSLINYLLKPVRL